MRGIRCALIVAVFAVACGGGGTEPAANGNTGGTGATGGGGGNVPVSTTSVTVEDNQFNSKNIVVAVGSTVTWTWSATNAHNVTFPSGSSSITQTSGQFSRQFPAAGTFSYQCTQHPGMTGSVLVQ